VAPPVPSPTPSVAVRSRMPRADGSTTAAAVTATAIAAAEGVHDRGGGGGSPIHAKSRSVRAAPRGVAVGERRCRPGEAVAAGTRKGAGKAGAAVHAAKRGGRGAAKASLTEKNGPGGPSGHTRARARREDVAALDGAAKGPTIAEEKARVTTAAASGREAEGDVCFRPTKPRQLRRRWRAAGPSSTTLGAVRRLRATRRRRGRRL